MKTLFKICLVILGIALSVVAASPVAHGQTLTTLTNPGLLINPNGLALDTGSQAAAEGPKTVAVKRTQKTINIILKTTKISGTIAGTVSWQGSNTGVSTDFYTISTTALVDATTNYGYREVDKAFLYYRALITQTGTSSLSYSATYYVTAGPLTK